MRSSDLGEVRHKNHNVVPLPGAEVIIRRGQLPLQRPYRGDERPEISSTGFRTAFVLILMLAVSALFVAVIRPFLKRLLLGPVLASLCTTLRLGPAAGVHSPLSTRL
jgi:hypothetical protein